MKEGWLNDDYLILFDEPEIATASDRYSFPQLLPGFQPLGPLGWDDFIVRDSQGATFSIPTVPLDRKYLSPFTVPTQTENLAPDARFKGKIKWYLKPIAFGGDPATGSNVVWVSHEEHAQLVKYWNATYRSATDKGWGAPQP